MWYEAALPPGKLRIDVGPAKEGNGYIFSDGNITIVKGNKVVATRHDVNMLLVLGFDVYRQDPAATIKIVKDQGYDLTKLREDVWEGKPAYVVGNTVTHDVALRYGRSYGRSYVITTQRRLLHDAVCHIT